MMGCCRKWCTLSAAIIAALLGYGAHNLFKIPPVPELDENQWWGSGKPSTTPETSIRPFKVDFSEKITELKMKLNSSDWFTEPLEGIGFEYGFNGKYLKEVVEFWKTKYEFAERQKYINKYPQFKTKIQGLDIHFTRIQQKPAKNVRIIPLLLIHGWPGSFVEFHKMIPLLMAATKDSDFTFDFIVPSLPGYGYSQASAKPGLGATQMAVIMKNLMQRLGYQKYLLQGGDWGAIITNAMAVLFPQFVFGYHTNMPIVQTDLGTIKALWGSLYPPMVIEEEHESKVYPLTKFYQYLLEETGYMHLQSTKPDTVGIGLMDSPIGLAAYILEKFSTWTNRNWKSLPDGGLTKKYTLLELLDNIMIYWDSRCITTSMRLYAETFCKAHHNLGMDSIPVSVPTAVIRFGNELTFATKWQMRGKYNNLVQVTDYENGGHFAAMEEPAILAKDIVSAVVAFDKFYRESKQ